MKVDDALRNVTRIFLDSAPVIYFVERHPQYLPVVKRVFTRIDEGTLPAISSPMTLLECLVLPCRLRQVNVQRDFTDLIVSGQGIIFVPLAAPTARRAAELRANYNLPTADACQIATALESGCDAVLTNDHDLKRVQEITILLIDELEV